MKAYSLDFREKIVSAYKAGNTSIRKIAERFMVTIRTVHRLIKQKEETGDLTPGLTIVRLDYHKGRGVKGVWDSRLLSVLIE
jgi:transposase-like protein